MRMKRVCASLANCDWLHVNSTRFLTHLAWHAKRGRKALEDIGIWPRFRGRSMRDRWASYDHYPCAQSICGAHVVRDCVYVCEQEQQAWAAEMADLRLRMAKAADQWRQRGAHKQSAAKNLLDDLALAG